MIAHNWKLLRTKGDPTVDDTDWVGTVTDTGLAAASDPSAANATIQGPAMTGIMAVCIPIVSTVNLGLVARGAGTVDMTMVVQIARDRPAQGGTPGVANGLVDSVTELAVPLCRMVYFPLNGALAFTIRITNDAAYPGGSTALQIWYREVSL